MRNPEFWSDPTTIANFAKGEYLASGGAKYVNGLKRGEIKMLDTVDNLERGFFQGINPNEITYVEKDLLTGKIKKVTLDKATGKPVQTTIDGWVHGGVYTKEVPKGNPTATKFLSKATDTRKNLLKELRSGKSFNKLNN